MGGTSCNSTPNSTSDKSLTIRAVRAPRWNGGTSNDKNYFSEKSTEKVLTTVKNYTKENSHQKCFTVNTPMKEKKKMFCAYLYRHRYFFSSSKVALFMIFYYLCTIFHTDDVPKDTSGKRLSLW